jgi:uroporphyrinogen-III synthase
MIKLLSTKKLSEKNIAYARSFNFDITCVDFIEVVPTLWNESVLKDFNCDSVAFTSSSGVKYFLDHSGAREWIKTKSIFAILGKTSEELQRHGLIPIMSASDSAALTDGVIEKEKTKCILHVSGNIRLDTLERKVKQAGIDYYPLVVYNTLLRKGIHLEENFPAILFFSPSGVEGYLSANEINDKTICICIGNTTAAKLRERVNCARIVISPFPSPKTMIERAAMYFDRHRDKKTLNEE